MAVPRSSVFLERQTYRRRRLIDLIKILPLIGLALWLVPLLWSTEGEDQVTSAAAMIYVFVIWLVLVVMKFIAARGLKTISSSDESETGRGEHGQS